ncbi:FixH family protein [Mucilaginibacter koreensis]
MNWGRYVIIGMGCFMLFIISMGVYMFVQPEDYDQHYYEEGLNYDHDYNRKKQVLQDNARPEIQVTRHVLMIKFTGITTGKLMLLRAADRRLDKTFALQSGMDNQISIPLTQVARGPWNLRFEWVSNQKEYLYEQEVTIE